jgi:two-component system NarL family response regulator
VVKAACRPLVEFGIAVMTPIKVLTVDDHPLLREGIAAVLSNQADLTVVGEASNGFEAVERCRALAPDIVLMDLEMPNMNGIEAIAAIRTVLPKTHVIVVTAHGSDAQILRALNAGAAGYLLKDGLRKELVDTIRRVHAGHRGFSPAVAQRIVERQMDDALTERELGVLMSVAAGNSNKIVADKLSISEETVKTHMRSILSKLGANDRTHAVTIAVKRGLISL